MTRFYKGVGVGTYLYNTDLRYIDVAAAAPSAPDNWQMAREHVARGVVLSPYVSVTRSYGVARDYALNGGKVKPTISAPGYVYFLEIPDFLGRPRVIYDPVSYIASNLSDPLVSPSYHHDGNKKFLLSVVDPIGNAAIATIPPSKPFGMGGGGQNVSLTQELEGMVFALRDAEALIVGGILATWVSHQRDDIY